LAQLVCALRINKEGFLEEAKKAQKDASAKREKDKQVSLFQAMKDWAAKHGDISQFDASKTYNADPPRSD
jgi:hypothetical protein